MRFNIASIFTLCLSSSAVSALVANHLVPVTSADFRKQAMGKKSALSKGYSLKATLDSKGVATISKVPLPSHLPPGHGLSMGMLNLREIMAYLTVDNV